jgi:hypothetical protein
MASPVGRTGVTGDPLAPVEDLDGFVSDTDIDEFTDQAVRGGIPMAIDLDVVVGGDAATLPARKDILLPENAPTEFQPHSGRHLSSVASPASRARAYSASHFPNSDPSSDAASA